MKKFPFIASLAFLSLGGLMVSCSSDPEYDDTDIIEVSEGNFMYNSDGVWTENEKPGFLTIDDYEFSHSVDDYGYVYGFTPSKSTNTEKPNPLSSFTYAAAAGGGVNGPGSQYLVGYWAEYLEGENCEFNKRTCRIYDEDGDTFQPQSVMACVNTYLMYAALDGTDFSPKFTDKDYVALIVHGVHLDGTEDTVPIYLINVSGENVESGIQTSWKQFDLSSLGTCTGLYFTMQSSENLKSEYGLNIPTYFCLDQLIVKE